MIKSENLLQELFENSGAVVLITDEKYNIRYSSSAVQSIFGHEPISLAGKNVFEFAPAEKRDRWRECLEQAGNSKRAEIQLKSSKGEDLYFDVMVTNHIAHHEIQGMVIMLHDITARTRRNVELEKENEHLDQFIFKTTHDIRSPLHSALGLLALLENAQEQDRTKYLRLVRNSLVKLESLIDEVNKFYQVDRMAIARRKIDLGSLLQEEIDMLSNHPRAQDIAFTLNCNMETDVFSDPLRLKTIFGNILSNAVKYSDAGKQRSFIRIDAEATEKSIIVTVCDNGIGIAKENIDRIFEIFFRGTAEASGTGLGLHIVKDTVDRLNGVIEVQSQLTMGTQFKICLPNLLFSTSEALLSEDESKAQS